MLAAPEALVEADAEFDALSLATVDALCETVVELSALVLAASESLFCIALTALSEAEVHAFVLSLAASDALVDASDDVFILVLTTSLMDSEAAALALRLSLMDVLSERYASSLKLVLFALAVEAFWLSVVETESSDALVSEAVCDASWLSLFNPDADPLAAVADAKSDSLLLAALTLADDNAKLLSSADVVTLMEFEVLVDCDINMLALTESAIDLAFDSEADLLSDAAFVRFALVVCESEVLAASDDNALSEAVMAASDAEFAACVDFKLASAYDALSDADLDLLLPSAASLKDFAVLMAASLAVEASACDLEADS